MSTEPFSRLRELAATLPRGLRSDWDGTNHYEMTSSEEPDDYFWLIASEGFVGIRNPSKTSYGRRLGLLMDIAAEVGRLRDEGLL